MQSQSENINIRENLWNSNEIKELIEYARHLQAENEDLQAKMIMMHSFMGDQSISMQRSQKC